MTESLLDLFDSSALFHKVFLSEDVEKVLCLPSNLVHAHKIVKVNFLQISSSELPLCALNNSLSFSRVHLDTFQNIKSIFCTTVALFLSQSQKDFFLNCACLSKKGSLRQTMERISEEKNFWHFVQVRVNWSL